MPKHLLAACLIYIAALTFQAAFAPLHETGIWKIVTPILCLSFAATALLFILRKRWTWRYMRWVAFFGVLINVAFFPTSKFYGSFTFIAQALSVIEIAACAVILWSMLRHQPSERWFLSRNEG